MARLVELVGDWANAKRGNRCQGRRYGAAGHLHSWERGGWVGFGWGARFGSEDDNADVVEVVEVGDVADVGDVVDVGDVGDVVSARATNDECGSEELMLARRWHSARAEWTSGGRTGSKGTMPSPSGMLTS